MKRNSVLTVVVLSAFLLMGAQCSVFSGGPSEAEIALQNQITQIETDLSAAQTRNDSLAAQLAKANEDLQLVTDPEQIAAGAKIIADMEAQRAEIARQMEVDRSQRDLLEANRKAAESVRLAAEANAKADADTTIGAVLSLIPPPWGTIGTAVFMAVAGFAEAKRRKEKAEKEKAENQRDASIRATDRAKTNVVRDPSTGKVVTFTVDAAKLETAQDATPGLSKAVAAARN